MTLEKRGRAEQRKTPDNLTGEEWEGLLWQRAEEISGLRTTLKDIEETLFQEVESMKRRPLNLHEKDILAEKEAAYWKASQERHRAEEEETRLEQALRDIANKVVNVQVLQTLVKIPTQEERRISKRKARILEERERLAKLEKERSNLIFDPLAVGEAQQVTHLTTGRHATGIKGSINPADAEREFYYRTTDTHGGKVGHGKKRRKR